MQKLVASALLVALLAASPANAGVVLTFEETAPGATTPVHGTAWVEADRLRMDTGDSTVVFRGDKGTLWAWSKGDKVIPFKARQAA